MSEKPPSCVLLADRHHGLTEGVRGLLETAFGTVVMVADEASLLEGAGRLQPDVAIVDLSLARDGGLRWLRSAAAALSRPQGDRPQRPRRAGRAPGGDGGRRRRLRAQACDRDRPAAGRRLRPRRPQPLLQPEEQRRRSMKVIIVGGVAGGASCAARLRRLDEKAEILMVERGPYVSYANCGLPYHVGGVIEKESSLLVANEQVFRANFAIDVPDGLRGDLHLAEEEDRGPAQRRDRRGDDRVLRQAGAVARGALGPSAPARNRSARDLPGEDRAGRADDPRVDRAGHGVPGRDVQLLGDPVREARAARGGDRRRLHRSRDGGEPGPRRVRRDARRDARSGPGPARPGVRPPRRGTPEEARRPPGARRRRGRLQAAGRRRARGADEVRQDAIRPTS